MWTVPATRMKGGREHRVPLSPRAAEIVGAMAKIRTGEFVFPSTRPQRPLSGMAMEMYLRWMRVEDVTVHGFRSSFRDWAGGVRFSTPDVNRGYYANGVVVTGSTVGLVA